jgi:predicted O-methyltransferase YrrM
MRDIVSISFAQFSRAFWERIETDAVAADLERRFREIGGGPYCIDAKVGYWLFCLAHFYEPKTVCEIGTYRGRSATALALGMESGKLWTCDKDNDWLVPSPNQVQIIQHRKMGSTSMLSEMKELIDLFFFDGRVQVDDVPHIKRLSHKNTVYVFDDFEGLEKGVHNALKLNDPSKILITQNDRLAALIPWETIRVTHQ